MKLSTGLFMAFLLVAGLLTGCKECRICSAKVDVYFIKVNGDLPADTLAITSDFFPNDEKCGAELDQIRSQKPEVQILEGSTVREVRVITYTCL